MSAEPVSTVRREAPVGLVAELQRLSTADQLVDVSAVPGPTSRWCCGRPAVVFVAFGEPCGLRTRQWEYDLCAECAREVIGRTWADYVDVEVRIPAGSS